MHSPIFILPHGNKYIPSLLSYLTKALLQENIPFCFDGDLLQENK